MLEPLAQIHLVITNNKHNSTISTHTKTHLHPREVELWFHHQFIHWVQTQLKIAINKVFNQKIKRSHKMPDHWEAELKSWKVIICWSKLVSHLKLKWRANTYNRQFSTRASTSWANLLIIRTASKSITRYNKQATRFNQQVTTPTPSTLITTRSHMWGHICVSHLIRTQGRCNWRNKSPSKGRRLTNRS